MWDDCVHEVDVECIFGVDCVVCVIEFVCVVDADPSREMLRVVEAGNDAEVHLGLSEFCLVVCVEKVVCECEFVVVV